MEEAFAKVWRAVKKNGFQKKMHKVGRRTAKAVLLTQMTRIMECVFLFCAMSRSTHELSHIVKRRLWLKRRI